MRQLLYPFLPYRSFIVPILFLSAIVVPCWVAFRLYRRRTREIPLRRELLLLTFVVYLAALAAVTLWPNRSSRLVAAGTGRMDFRPSLSSLTCSTSHQPSGSRARGFCIRNARGNLLLFFPLGVLIPLVWPRVRFWKGLGIAIAVSFGIEFAQYISSAWGSYRSADVNDLILNSMGAGLGLALTSLSLRSRPVSRVPSAHA